MATITTFFVATTEKYEVVDITPHVAAAAATITDGLAMVFTKHSTMSILICADEPNLRRDLLRVAQRWLADYGPYEHIQENLPNAEAHILSAFGGTAVTIPITDGQLALGTYQQVLLLELDGPRTRQIHVQTAAL